MIGYPVGVARNREFTTASAESLYSYSYLINPNLTEYEQDFILNNKQPDKKLNKDKIDTKKLNKLASEALNNK